MQTNFGLNFLLELYLISTFAKYLTALEAQSCLSHLMCCQESTQYCQGQAGDQARVEGGGRRGGEVPARDPGRGAQPDQALPRPAGRQEQLERAQPRPLRVRRGQLLRVGAGLEKGEERLYETSRLRINIAEARRRKINCYIDCLTKI